jgi:hypothetical protein
MPYYLSWFIALLFTDQYVYFYTSNCSWNYKPSGVANKALDYHYKLWENHDFTLQPVITYTYLFERISVSCLFHFSNHSSVMDQKLN